MQSRVSSISEERDQLQEALESLRQQKQQLQEELEDRMEAVRGHLTFTNDVVVLKPLRTHRDESNVLFHRLLKPTVASASQRRCKHTMRRQTDISKR